VKNARHSAPHWVGSSEEPILTKDMGGVEALAGLGELKILSKVTMGYHKNNGSAMVTRVIQ